ncbi:hypothetical protein [Stutzerimonas nitrititolerans]|uniref:hypothetical protein n=1 Tax=Stutzerimonas nitrititolerans TaxID=2482751 RepID=UPI00289C2D82|nr:hypothetical protein [Stutzerimonas nitrititolerans]
MKYSVIPVIALLITGCTTAQNTPATGGFSYEDVRFAAADQTIQTPSKFNQDITECHNIAQVQYATDIKNSAKLAEIYGQAISPEVFAQKRKAQVVDCMTGKITGKGTGKGWLLAQDS